MRVPSEDVPMESMGLLSFSTEASEDLSDLELPLKPKKPLWRRYWPAIDARKPRLCGLPIGWLIVIGLVLTAIVILVCAVLGNVLRKPSTPETGHYPADAPFREVFRTNFPDPALWRHNDTWYAYGTNNAAGILDSKLHGQLKDLGSANIQLATSPDFLNWTLHAQADDPLYDLGSWVNAEKMPAFADHSITVRRANVWAPSIVQRPDGKFVLYYSATTAGEANKHCIGAAVSDSPLGPFEPQDQPIACPIDLGGAIDTAAFVDIDSKLYVAYKIDGNALGHGGECLNTVAPLKSTPILLQQMEQDGVTRSGEPVQILDRVEDDGPLVEAPAIVRSEEGIYFLFYSSGCTWNPSYDVKYATSTSITGPYTRASKPLLKTGYMGLYAPGSPSVRQDGHIFRIAFHARVYTDLGGIRALYVADLKLNGTTASLDAPT